MTEKPKTGGKAKVANAVRAAKAEPEAEKSPSADAKSSAPLPKSFEIRDGKLIRLERGDQKEILLGDAIEIGPETCDQRGENWGIVIYWSDRRNRRHFTIVPRDQLTGDCMEVRTVLANKGYRLNNHPNARPAWAEFWGLVKSDKFALTVCHGGWHYVADPPVFVLRDRNYGKAAEQIFFQGDETQPSPFNKSGTHMDWVENVSNYCIGNSRLLFVVSMAFAAPLLGVLREQGGGFNLRGKAQTGKTTLLRVAASVWGGTPGRGAAGYVQTARGSANGMEAAACLHSDTLFPLDELGEIDAKGLGEVAYFLSNGQTKLRSTRQGGSLRPVMHFRVLFLVSSEVSLQEKLREAGQQMKAGQEVRFTDVPSEAHEEWGVFDTLHDFPSPSAFATELKAGFDRFYGVAADLFLTRLTEHWRANVDFPERLRCRCNELLAVWLKPLGQVNGQVRSIGFRFALAAVAGEMASEWGVTGWIAGEASKGVHACFKSFLADRGTVGTREDEQAVTKLRDCLTRHGESRFALWPEPRLRHDAEQADVDEPPAERFRTQNRMGWRRWTCALGGGAGCWTYYVTTEGMGEVLQGLSKRDAIAALVRRGLLVRTNEGRGSRSVFVPGHGKMRLYEVTQSALSDCDNDGPFVATPDRDDWLPQTDADGILVEPREQRNEQ